MAVGCFAALVCAFTLSFERTLAQEASNNEPAYFALSPDGEANDPSECLLNSIFNDTSDFESSGIDEELTSQQKCNDTFQVFEYCHNQWFSDCRMLLMDTNYDRGRCVDSSSVMTMTNEDYSWAGSDRVINLELIGLEQHSLMSDSSSTFHQCVDQLRMYLFASEGTATFNHIRFTVRAGATVDSQSYGHSTLVLNDCKLSDVNGLYRPFIRVAYQSTVIIHGFEMSNVSALENLTEYPVRYDGPFALFLDYYDGSPDIEIAQSRFIDINATDRSNSVIMLSQIDELDDQAVFTVENCTFIGIESSKALFYTEAGTVSDYRLISNEFMNITNGVALFDWKSTMFGRPSKMLLDRNWFRNCMVDGSIEENRGSNKSAIITMNTSPESSKIRIIDNVFQNNLVFMSVDYDDDYSNSHHSAGLFTFQYLSQQSANYTGTQVSYLLLQNNEFIHNKGQDSSILLIGTLDVNLTIVNNVFLQNSPGLFSIIRSIYPSVMNVLKNEFSDNHGALYGGVLDVQSTKDTMLYLQNNLGMNNSGIYGGMLSLRNVEASVLSIQKNHLINNSALFGGVLFMDSLKDGSSMSIFDNNFESNYAESAAGSIDVELLDSSLMMISNNTFFKNYCYRDSGVIRISYSFFSLINVKWNIFRENHANYYTCLDVSNLDFISKGVSAYSYSYSSSSLMISDNLFIDNVAFYGNGVLMAVQSAGFNQYNDYGNVDDTMSMIQFVRNIAERNLADANGGYKNYQNRMLSDEQLIYGYTPETSGVNSGGMLSLMNIRVNVLVSENEFHHNHFGRFQEINHENDNNENENENENIVYDLEGGAVSLSFEYGANGHGTIVYCLYCDYIRIESNLLTNNSALTGGLFRFYGTLQVKVIYNEMRSNFASLNGGLLNIEACSHLLWQGNFAQTFGCGQLGGAIYASGFEDYDSLETAGIQIIGSIFDNTMIQEQSYLNTKIISSNDHHSSVIPAFGGVIHASNGARLLSSNSNFTGCEATTAGGCIFGTDLNQIVLEYSYFKESSVKGYGGAVFVESSSVIYINNNSFINNRANSMGGALLLDCLSSMVYYQNESSLSEYSCRDIDLSNNVFRLNRVECGSVAGTSLVDVSTCRAHDLAFVHSDYDSFNLTFYFNSVDNSDSYVSFPWQSLIELYGLSEYNDENEDHNDEEDSSKNNRRIYKVRSNQRFNVSAQSTGVFGEDYEPFTYCNLNNVCFFVELGLDLTRTVNTSDDDDHQSSSSNPYQISPTNWNWLFTEGSNVETLQLPWVKPGDLLTLSWACASYIADSNNVTSYLESTFFCPLQHRLADQVSLKTEGCPTRVVYEKSSRYPGFVRCLGSDFKNVDSFSMVNQVSQREWIIYPLYCIVLVTLMACLLTLCYDHCCFCSSVTSEMFLVRWFCCCLSKGLRVFRAVPWLWYIPMIWLFQVFDFLTDLNLCQAVWRTWIYHRQKDTLGDDLPWLIVAVSATVFTVIPFLLNLIYAARLQSLLEYKAPSNHQALLYFRDYRMFLALATVISGSAIEVIRMANSRILGLSMFSMGLTLAELEEFRKDELWLGTLSENLPQLIIQGATLMLSVQSKSYSHRINTTVVVSLVSSLLSVAAVVLSYVWAWRDRSTRSLPFKLDLHLELGRVHGKRHARLSERVRRERVDLTGVIGKEFGLRLDRHVDLGYVLISETRIEIYGQFCLTNEEWNEMVERHQIQHVGSSLRARILDCLFTDSTLFKSCRLVWRVARKDPFSNRFILRQRHFERRQKAHTLLSDYHLNNNNSGNVGSKMMDDSRKMDEGEGGSELIMLCDLCGHSITEEEIYDLFECDLDLQRFYERPRCLAGNSSSYPSSASSVLSSPIGRSKMLSNWQCKGNCEFYTKNQLIDVFCQLVPIITRKSDITTMKRTTAKKKKSEHKDGSSSKSSLALSAVTLDDDSGVGGGSPSSSSMMMSEIEEANEYALVARDLRRILNRCEKTSLSYLIPQNSIQAVRSPLSSVVPHSVELVKIAADHYVQLKDDDEDETGSSMVHSNQDAT